MLLDCLVNSGADINAANEVGLTPYEYRPKQVSRFSLQCIATVLVYFCWQVLGETAFAAAVQSGRLDASMLFAEKGGDLTCRDRDGRTLLMKAAQGGYLDLVEFLVRSAAIDVNARDHDKVWAHVLIFTSD